MNGVDYYMCPTCEKDVKVGSHGCPHCARVAARKRVRSKVAAKKREWEEEEGIDGLGLPDEDFDYADFVAKEFGGKSAKRVGIHPVWWWTALMLVVAIVALIAWGSW